MHVKAEICTWPHDPGPRWRHTVIPLHALGGSSESLQLEEAAAAAQMKLTLTHSPFYFGNHIVFS